MEESRVESEIEIEILAERQERFLLVKLAGWMLPSPKRIIPEAQASFHINIIGSKPFEVIRNRIKSFIKHALIVYLNNLSSMASLL